MFFEDEFMDKQSEIIALYKDVVNENVETIYVFVFYDAYSSMSTSAFMVNGIRCGILDAGISDEKNNDILDIIEEEIIPELEEICEEHSKPMPQEFRFIYDVKTGALDADYRYEKELSKIEEYDPGIAAQEWMELVFNAQKNDK